jgi:hypothetical protein
MPKFLDVTMPDGSLWRVPAHAVADNRATFYSDEGPDAYETELAYTLSDDYELTDWARNNMNWSDVAAQAVRLPDPPKPPVDYQEGWVNGPMKVVEVPG